ncbi:MAG: amino acid adenylation domain-containing protein [Acidimicrobiia bacterium]|nr:amino acid adenylation domain-containing protein [Acidimicrobiia bacterium]
MSKLLHTALSEVAAVRPETPAVVMGSEHISYAELDEASSRLANALRHRGCEPGDRVALLLRKSPEAIVALAGVLKAGCAYVPLDPQSPASRLSAVVESSRPAALIGHSATADTVGRLAPGCLVGMMDGAEGATSGLGYDEWRSAPAGPLHAIDPSELAYVMYTSGSTGQPKGVPITHANATHFVDWAVGHYGLAAGDRNSSHPPLHFDLSVLDVFGTLGTGGTLHLVPPEANLLPASIGGLIAEQQLTQWFSVPSILTYIAKHDAIPQGGYPSLRRVLACGEVLPTATLIYWMERVPHARFSNLYGPTETTVASSFHDVVDIPADATSAVPIGRPLPGEELLVMTADMEPAATGEIGDLFIAGAGLSPGYWEDPAKTKAAFVPDGNDPGRTIYRTGDLASVDENGVHHFHGRSDTQIKSRGYRIELGDIETALSGLDYLLNAVVVPVRDDTFGSVSVSCAYIPRPGQEVSPTRIRRDLHPILPSYMIPTGWREFVSFPTNRNGKIDRPAIQNTIEGGPISA